ncbi:MAG: penicillin acylase family protein [Burkholderiales bacterium]
MSNLRASSRVVQGLSAPIQISIDRCGVPHIQAQTVEDAFFGQGYSAALLRLWQLDLNHRRQVGTLAEAFGQEFVRFDRVAHLLMFRGPIQDEWAKLDPKVEGIATAFVAGINARVEEVLNDPTLLPPEFVALGMQPGKWIKDDLLRARVSNSPNIQGEVRRSMLAARGMLDLDALAHPLEPAWPLTIPAGLDPAWVTRADLEILNDRLAPLPFDKIAKGLNVNPSLSDRIFQPDIDSRNGSNAWVVAPARSSTGRPILANDPHLAFSIPSPRMVTHLSAPGFNVTGAGPVWRPGVQFGHNERIAFGRTDFQIDQEDLYVLELTQNGACYRGPTGDMPIERVTQEIKVHGRENVTLDLAFTALGPVVSERRHEARAVVLRAAWLQPGAAVNLEYVPKLFAKNWDEFRGAIRHAVWGTNYLYADVDGNIGWQSAGRVPVRPNHDGLMPVPASGDYPWEGILPLEQMPGEFNPLRGWIASANQMPFPDDWPVAQQRISFEWTANDRYNRIVERFTEVSGLHSPEDSWNLQQDIYSSRARTLLNLLVNADGMQAIPERAFLLNWDCQIDANQQEAALYEIWSATLQREVRKLLVPPPLQDIIAAVHPHVVLGVLEHPDERLGPDPVKARDALLLKGLLMASDDLNARGRRLDVQPDWLGRTYPCWGQLHDVTLRHPLESRLPKALADISGVSGHGSSGDGSTVYARWWPGLDNTHVTGGSSFRAVVDVGARPRAVAAFGPGQSGSPGDEHYRDLYDPWLDNTPVPLWFEPDEVSANAHSVIQLVPRGN